jgi:hypothetical protein
MVFLLRTPAQCRVMGRGERNHWRACGTGSNQKGAIVEGGVEQAGTASNIREDARTSSGVTICLLSVNHPQASHLHTEDPCTSKAAIMICTDTKKDGRVPPACG